MFNFRNTKIIRFRICISKIKLRVCLDTAYFVENWKHCNKIIFKCVNSAMGPIFKFFLWIKWLWAPWIMHEQCALSPKSWNVCIKKLLKKKKRKTQNGRRRKIHLNPNIYLILLHNMCGINFFVIGEILW